MKSVDEARYQKVEWGMDEERYIEEAGSSAMLGAVIVAGFASAFWFCVGLAIGWAM